VDFARVFAEVARFLDGERARHGVVGAVALHALGFSRVTGDLDLVVEETARDALLPFLDRLGYERLHVSEGFSNHVHADPAWGRLDFIYVDRHTADLLFARAVRLPLFPDVEALVPRPEHLAAMKVLAMKNNPSRALKELPDIQFLLQLPGVDEAEILGYFEKHGLAPRFEEIKRAIAGNPRD
jgi:hypothetical protein